MSDPSASPPIVVVVGPTGAGKTALAIALAERVGGEIVSADSQQVYRGMDIGTGKATAAEQARVRHHLLDILDPDEQMTAARFAELADRAIAELAARDCPVIVAGGTGLYVRALLFGLFEGPPADPAFRARLAARAEADGGPQKLWERLRDIDPDSAERIHDTDLIRITRALEVYEQTGVTMTEHHRTHDHTRVPMRYRARLVGLRPEREELYRRIDARVDRMIEAGWLDEVRALRDAGYRPPLRSQAAIGYGELHAYLAEGGDLAETITLIKRNSRRYARRQLSWYRRDPAVEWYGEGSEVDLDDLERYLAGSNPSS
jgi:tRNA dimethylallyltransferase